MARTKKPAGQGAQTGSYAHPEAQSLFRPDVGTQAQFRKKKLQKTVSALFEAGDQGQVAVEVIDDRGGTSCWW